MNEEPFNTINKVIFEVNNELFKVQQLVEEYIKNRDYLDESVMYDILDQIMTNLEDNKFDFRKMQDEVYQLMMEVSSEEKESAFIES